MFGFLEDARGSTQLPLPRVHLSSVTEIKGGNVTDGSKQVKGFPVREVCLERIGISGTVGAFREM